MKGEAWPVTRYGGNTTWTRDYYPYGSDRNATGGWNPEHYKFTGKAQDGETGLYYFGAQYYDPTMGRFTQPDPLAVKYPGWSPYVYALDNPMKYVDHHHRAGEGEGAAERSGKGCFISYRICKKSLLNE